MKQKTKISLLIYGIVFILIWILIIILGTFSSYFEMPEPVEEDLSTPSIGESPSLKMLMTLMLALALIGLFISLVSYIIALFVYERAYKRLSNQLSRTTKQNIHEEKNGN